MKPDYRNAAEKALETLTRYNVDISDINPLAVLKQIQNVLLISYGTSDECSSVLDDNKDAITLVNRKKGKLQFIIIYNHFLSEIKLRSALARELAHVILEHDGTSPEEVWSEEANCFAYHFLCPMTITRKIHFRPLRKCLSAELKDVQEFDSLDALRYSIAEKRTRMYHFVGKKDAYFAPSEVRFVRSVDFDDRTGWRNCFDVILDGITVGHCGE